MPATTLRQRARILMWLVTIPFACLCLLTALLLGNIAWQGGRFADTVAVYYLPMFLYMWAIWMIRRALRAIAAGDLYANVLPKLLTRVGAALFGGALYNVFGWPLVGLLLDGRLYSRTFEASAVTLGIVGAALMLFAQLLGGAAAMREELDAFV